MGYVIIDETIDNPVVSVAMLTYNHSKYIKEAIDSVLMQETDFPIQLVIAEDYSPDNTREIILDYQKKYPHIIKLLLQNENVGAKQNNHDLFENLDGKYIAALEGDDYWIYNEKLQKQVDFLESNSDCSMCFHNALVRDENSNKEYLFSNNAIRFYTGEEILRNWTIPTASVVFRKTVLNVFQMLDKKDIIYEDIVLFLSSLEKGKIYNISQEPWSFYRRHCGGVSYIHRPSIIFLSDMIAHFKKINESFDFRYSKAINERICLTYAGMGKQFFRERNMFGFFCSFVKSFYSSPKTFIRKCIKYGKE